MKKIKMFLAGLVLITLFGCQPKTVKIAEMVKRDAANYVSTHWRNDLIFDTLIVVHDKDNQYEGVMTMHYSNGNRRDFSVHITYDGDNCLFSVDQ